LLTFIKYRIVGYKDGIYHHFCYIFFIANIPGIFNIDPQVVHKTLYSKPACDISCLCTAHSVANYKNRNVLFFVMENSEYILILLSDFAAVRNTPNFHLVILVRTVKNHITCPQFALCGGVAVRMLLQCPSPGCAV
jgi:hypothetical protein